MIRAPIHRILLLSSVLCVCATAYLVATYGEQVYFLMFHRPFHLSALITKTTALRSPTLPMFKVRAAITKTTLEVGDTQHITVTVTPGKTVQGFLEVWVTAPSNKQVYKSLLDERSPHEFVGGRTEMFTFDYIPEPSAPRGTYHVSDNITSANMQTDYYVNEEFASFAVL